MRLACCAGDRGSVLDVAAPVVEGREVGGVKMWRRPRDPPTWLWSTLALPWFEKQELEACKKRKTLCERISETIVEVSDVISPEECQLFVQAACRRAEQVGWFADRGWEKVLRTEDVKINSLDDPRATDIFESRVVKVLARLIAESYGLPAASLRHLDAYLARYSADRDAGTYARHRDNALVTAILTLSSPSDYSGGGTDVDGLQYRPGQGGAVLFAGARVHSGSPITSGTRYIITIFFATEDYGCKSCHLWTKDQNPLWEGSPLNLAIALQAVVVVELLVVVWEVCRRGGMLGP